MPPPPLGSAVAGGDREPAPDASVPETDAAPLFVAIQPQLGLKRETKKAPRDILGPATGQQQRRRRRHGRIGAHWPAWVVWHCPDRGEVSFRSASSPDGPRRSDVSMRMEDCVAATLAGRAT